MSSKLHVVAIIVLQLCVTVGIVETSNQELMSKVKTETQVDTYIAPLSLMHLSVPFQMALVIEASSDRQ